MTFVLRERVPLKDNANVLAVPVGSSLQGMDQKNVNHANPDSTLWGETQLHACRAGQKDVSVEGAQKVIVHRVVSRPCLRQYCLLLLHLLTHAPSAPLVPLGFRGQTDVETVPLARLPDRAVAYAHHAYVEKFRADEQLPAPRARQDNISPHQAAPDVKFASEVHMLMFRVHANARNVPVDRSQPQMVQFSATNALPEMNSH